MKGILNHYLFRTIITSFLLLGAVESQTQEITKQRTAVIDTLLRLVESRYVYPDIARKMTIYVRKRQQQHAYDTIGRGEALARILTEDLRSISRDGHLGLEYSSTVIPIESAQGPPSQQAMDDFKQQGVSDNFAFRRLEILDGNIGYLKLNAFWPSAWIKETASGAMAFLANSDVIILDLRDNHGFADGGGLIQSYFFEEPTHMSDYINRDDGTRRQFWTMPVVPGPKLTNKKLYILVSHDTFSAGEDFTYNMQAQKRAIVVGETTGGGAHGTRRYRLSDHFSASIPHVYSINPITGGDWEGKGVQPDITVGREDALRTAHIAALESIVANSKEKDQVKGLKEIIKRLQGGSTLSK
jgi:retinol-binding protein 3